MAIASCSATVKMATDGAIQKIHTTDGTDKA